MPLACVSPPAAALPLHGVQCPHPSQWSLPLGLPRRAPVPVSIPDAAGRKNASGGAPGHRSPSIGAPAMEKGKGLARRWAVELPDASSSSPTVPDPPGFTRSAPDAVTPTPPRSSFSLVWLCIPQFTCLLWLAGRRRRCAPAQGLRDCMEGAGSFDRYHICAWSSRSRPRSARPARYDNISYSFLRAQILITLPSSAII